MSRARARAMRHIPKEDTGDSKTLVQHHVIVGGGKGTGAGSGYLSCGVTTRTKVKKQSLSKPGATSNSKPVPIGDDYQVKIPKRVFSRSKFADHIKVRSQLVFSPDLCGGDKKVIQFLDQAELEELKCTGFPSAPSVIESHLHTLMAMNGDAKRALTSSNTSESKLWTKDDKQQLAFLVAEFGYNYAMLASKMRRDIPDMMRMCNENRDANNDMSLLFDVGSKRAGSAAGCVGELMAPDRVLNSFQALARNPCDGFPVDRRLMAAIKMYRKQSCHTKYDSRSSLLEADCARWRKARGKRLHSERSSQSSKNAHPRIS